MYTLPKRLLPEGYLRTVLVYRPYLKIALAEVYNLGSLLRF